MRKKQDEDYFDKAMEYVSNSKEKVVSLNKISLNTTGGDHKRTQRIANKLVELGKLSEVRGVLGYKLPNSDLTKS